MPQSNPIPGRNANARMDAEAFNQCTTVSRFHYAIPGIWPIPDPDYAPACAWAGCCAPRDGCAIEFGQQRLLAPKRIRFLRIRLRAKAPLFHKTQDTPMNAFRNAGNLGIRRRPDSPEYQFAPAVIDVDAIQCQ